MSDLTTSVGQTSKQNQQSVLKEKDLERVVWKGEFVHHVVWNSDEESGSETSPNHSAWSIISDSDEDVQCTTKHLHSECDGRSQEIFADEASQPSAAGHLHRSPHAVGIGIPHVHSPDPISQYGGCVPAAGDALYNDFRSKVVSGGGQKPWTKCARFMESLSTVAPDSMQSLPSMAASSSSDIPTMAAAYMDSPIAASRGEDNRAGKHRGKLRPCKDKRARYHKLVKRLTDQIDEDPEAFDIESIEMPPAVVWDDTAKAKLKTTLQMHLDQALSKKVNHPEDDSYKEMCPNAGSSDCSLSAMARSETESMPTESTKIPMKQQGTWRPCKGTRERHRKLSSHLKQAIEDEPYNFDLQAIQWPPSLASHPKTQAKLENELQEHMVKCQRRAAFMALGWQ